MMKTLLAAIVLTLASGGALAQKVYKHVDEKGNVTYSQVPPASDAQAVKVPPPRGASRYSTDLLYEQRYAEREAIEDRRREYERAEQQQREAMQESRRRQVEALRTECVRNRGTDCDDPATITRMEAERGPTQYRPRAR